MTKHESLLALLKIAKLIDHAPTVCFMAAEYECEAVPDHAADAKQPWMVHKMPGRQTLKWTFGGPPLRGEWVFETKHDAIEFLYRLAQDIVAVTAPWEWIVLGETDGVGQFCDIDNPLVLDWLGKGNVVRVMLIVDPRPDYSAVGSFSVD